MTTTFIILLIAIAIFFYYQIVIHPNKTSEKKQTENFKIETLVKQHPILKKMYDDFEYNQKYNNERALENGEYYRQTAFITKIFGKQVAVYDTSQIKSFEEKVKKKIYELEHNDVEVVENLIKNHTLC